MPNSNLSETRNQSPLTELLNRVKSESPAFPFVVFDLDSTLFCNAGRTFAIFAAFMGGKPECFDIIATLHPRTMPWGAEEPFLLTGANPRSLDGFHEFWEKAFFTNDYLLHDKPMPGAVRYVRDIWKAGGTVVYLSGRTERDMGQGTRASLLQSRFPYGQDRIRLILKEDIKEPDIEFKIRTISALSETGPVAGIVEDMIPYANRFYESFPNTSVILMDSVHPPDSPAPNPAMPHIDDFLLPENVEGPYLIVMSGLPATGKSSVARITAEGLRATHLSTDRLRGDLFPEDQFTREERYAPDAKKRVYEYLFSKGEQELGAGRSVVMDGTFLRNTRADVFGMAARHGARLVFIKTACSDLEVRRRLARRETVRDFYSEAHLQTYESMKHKFETRDPNFVDVTEDPLILENRIPHLVFDTGARTILAKNTESLPAMMESIEVDFPLYMINRG